VSDDDDDDDEAATQLLPMHHSRNLVAPKVAGSKPIRLTDVWDEREEVFGIGNESDDDEQTPSTPRHHNGVPVPTISVTQS
jgi:hypothetical protein